MIEEEDSSRQKFIHFFYHNFHTQYKDKHAINGLHETLSLWCEAQRKKNIIDELKDFFSTHKHLKTIVFTGEWSYMGNDGYCYEIECQAYVHENSVPNVELEEENLEYSIITGRVGHELSQFTDKERQAVIMSLQEINVFNIEHKLTEILYEEEEELLQAIEAYEKDYLARSIDEIVAVSRDPGKIYKI